MLEKVQGYLSTLDKVENARRHSPYVILCTESMTSLRDDICLGQSMFEGGVIRWGRFADGTPQIFIEDVHTLTGRDVVFIADFKATTDMFAQLSVIMMLPHYCARSVTLILPFFPTATMERIDQEGQVATAYTLAKLISATPASNGPSRVIIFDIHTLGNRFYFSDPVIPVLETAVALLLVRLLQSDEDSSTAGLTTPSGGAPAPIPSPVLPDNPPSRVGTTPFVPSTVVSSSAASGSGAWPLPLPTTPPQQPTCFHGHSVASLSTVRATVGPLASPTHNTASVAAAIGAQQVAPMIGIAFPDEGARKRFGGLFSSYPTIVCSKVRSGNTRVVTVSDGDPTGLHVVIVDDLVQSGGTLMACKDALIAAGATAVSAFVTHAIFPNAAYEKFFDAGFKHFWITNSVPDVAAAVSGRAPFEVLSLAPLIRETLWRLSPERKNHDPTQ